MAVNQDLYDTLVQYFNDNTTEFQTAVNSALQFYMQSSPQEFQDAVATSLQNYFDSNPIDIDFGSSSTFDSACQSSLSNYFSANPVSVDLSTTNTKIDTVQTTVNSIKTTVDTNLDAKVSSVSGGSIDLTATNQKIDDVKSVVDATKSVVDTNLNAKVGDVGNYLVSIAYDSDAQKIVTLKEIVASIQSGCDLSQVSYTIDGSNLDLSTLDDGVVQTISSSVSEFLANYSLNGSNGSLYPDGTTVYVEGDIRPFTVVGSQILTTIGGQADYFYRLRDDQGREMLTVQDNLSLSLQEGV